MIILNNQTVTDGENSKHIPVQEISTNVNDNGVTPVAIHIPGTTETALPIKLISNPNISFMVLCENVYNLKNNYNFHQLKKKYSNIVHHVQMKYLMEYIKSLNNKDIR
ncbi:MAG: hypothetical protein PF486_07545 [Prolixibacteraceae bacterium]|nr:hypothetical protein [Prolixibacteraceae bacterium]